MCGEEKGTGVIITTTGESNGVQFAFDSRIEPPLYRFMNRTDARSLVRQGQIRIGTLHDFRRTEEYGDERGDAGEGTATIYTSEDFELGDNSPEDRFVRGTFFTDRSKRAVIQNIRFQVPVDANVYVCCFCDKLDPNVMDDFGPVAIKVIQPAKFVEEIARALWQKKLLGPQMALAPCKYGSRERDVRTKLLHPAFLKPSRYAYQREVRAIFTPMSQELEPVIIESNALRRLCRFVSGRELKEARRSRGR